MSIAAIAAGSNQTATQNSQSSLSQLSGDYSRFMKLLVAQIQNQDPLNPVDNTEFISQVAQLTQVEQAVLTNQYIADLSGRLAMSGALFTTALIGREVTVASDSFKVEAGVGSFSYRVEKSVENLTAVIQDEYGQTLRQIDLGPAEGGALMDFTWDGLDVDGLPVPDGTYKVTLQGITAEDGKTGYETYSAWQVLGVDYDGGEVRLQLDGGKTAPASDIIRAG